MLYLTHLCYYPALDSFGDGVLLSIDFFVYLYISFFVSLSARLRENGWTDLHEIFREGVHCGMTMERPDYSFGQFRETARRRDAQHGGGVCCALAPQLVCIFNEINYCRLLA